jgi:hypothetical protein
MTYLLPNEILHGNTAQQTRMRRLLDWLRTCPEPAPLPDVETCSLPEMLDSGMTDRDLFYDGHTIMAARYRQLGASALLPFDRVRIGIRASAAKGSTRSYGGFHHPGQGYRHLQMTATMTTYGDLSAPQPAAPQSTALDLLRSYAHDCLHYATFRRYTLTGAGQIARVQYGINFRRPDGRAYSATDLPGTYATRNLGIVMEGATDTEATTIARQAAVRYSIRELDGMPGLSSFTFADTTGTLTGDAIALACGSPHPFLQALGNFNQAVTIRYRRLLTQLADDPRELHQLIVASMISGDLGALRQKLDARNGPQTFERLFRAASYGEEWD